LDDGRARRQLEAWYGLDLIPYLVLLDQRGRVPASRVRDGANVGPLPLLEALRHHWRGGP
jgi:hypothetical protein